MASKTLYQRQADSRTKNALKLRARYDAKARKAAALLVAALAGADQAKARIDRLNVLYNVDISTQTLLVHDLKTAGIDAALNTAMAASTPGEEVQLFNANVDGNGGRALKTEGVFGEIPGFIPAPTPTPTPTPAPAPAFSALLNGPRDESFGVTLASAAGTRFEFDSLALGTSAPASMDLTVGGNQVASIAYLDRYTGKAFAFTGADNTVRRGVFAAAVAF